MKKRGAERLLRMGLVAAAVGTLATLYAETADFLILANGNACRIFNAFEQELTENERRVFTAGIPLQVVKENAFLGDQVTPVMEVRFANRRYFLQKNDDGTLYACEGREVRRVTRCEVIDDTVMVVDEEGLIIRDDQGRLRGTARRGDRIRRIFRFGERYYVALDTLRLVFGWCSVDARAVVTHRLAIPTARYGVLTEILRDRIVRRLNSANRSYGEIFEYLNRVGKYSKTIPFWQWTVSGSTMVCTLHGFHNVASQLSRSTAILRRDIEEIVATEGFGVRGDGDTLYIGPLKR